MMQIVYFHGMLLFRCVDSNSETNWCNLQYDFEPHKKGKHVM